MLAFCAANAAYLAGLESGVPGGACLVAGTGAPLVQMLRRGEHVATTLDEHPDILRAVDGALSAGVVLGAAPVVELLEELGCDAVLPFKSGPRLWTMAEFQGLRVLATDAKLTRQLENKLALAELAKAADARIPDTVTVSLDDALVAAAREDGIALPRVFQPAVGFAGAGTVLLRTARDVEELVAHAPGGTRVGKLVEYVDGEPITINGVVIPPGVHGAGDDGEVLVGMVARQLTGIPRMTPTDFGSCGNDWALPPARSVVASARSLAGRVGEVLASRGFAGAFGIDVIVPSGGGVPVLIEINPRWTASLALQVELQGAAGLPTLLDAHLAAFAYRPDERASLETLRAAFGSDEDAECTRDVAKVSTVIAYNATGRDAHVDTEFEPGVWRASTGDDGAVALERVRDGWRLGDLERDDEVVILPHGNMRPIPHGSYLVRVIRRGQAAATPRANVLLDDVAALMDAVVARVTR
ncbi:MAG: acetyl-CoA carboxylase [Thermoleophilia bacterium]|nr:acetyl-CoA carboxylase [Thermoleophilia bacterium]